MDDHLSHGPTKSRGPCLRKGLRPTRACAPTWTCTVAEIARLIRPSRAGLRFYSSLQVQAPLQKEEVAFPIVGSRRPDLRPAPTSAATGPQTPATAGSDFANSGARKFLTTSSGCKQSPADLPVNAARSSVELSRMNLLVVNRSGELVYLTTAGAVHMKMLDGAHYVSRKIAIQ